MDADQSFRVLMERLQRGDDDAAKQVINRYARRLIGLARSKLDRLIRPKVGPEDVVNSAFKSFFARHAEGQFDLDSWDSLWTMLTVITVRKCARQAERFHGAKRDVGREVTEPKTISDSSAHDWLSGGRDPTPYEAAVLADTVEQLMHGLDQRERDILSLCLQGYSALEISEKVERTERTVHRVLGRLKKRLQRLRAAECDAD